MNAVYCTGTPPGRVIDPKNAGTRRKKGCPLGKRGEQIFEKKHESF